MVISSSPHLLRLIGPFAINAYGLALAIALFSFFYFTLKDSRRKRLIPDPEKFIWLVLYGALAGIIGSRLVYILVDDLAYFTRYPLQVFAIWDGGLSMLGALIFAPPAAYYLLRRTKTPLLPTLDLVCTYFPLFEAIARFGCLYAGCCHGAPTETTTLFSLLYTHPESLAPTGIPLFPTQLYTSALSLGVFFITLFLATRRIPTGTIFWSYLTCSSLIRFTVDFWRGDRGLLHGQLSSYQWIALTLTIIGLVGILSAWWLQPKRPSRWHESI